MTVIQVEGEFSDLMKHPSLLIPIIIEVGMADQHLEQG